jgi:hypothetical protein
MVTFELLADGVEKSLDELRLLARLSDALPVAR